MGTKQKQQGGEPGAQLDTLAVEIRREHEAVEAGARSTVEAAIRCGNLLRDAKTKVGHGGWMDWLATNFPASDRTARAYMRLADRYANRQLPASLTIDGRVEAACGPATEARWRRGRPSRQGQGTHSCGR